MALAKYREDIVDRYVDSVSPFSFHAYGPHMPSVEPAPPSSSAIIACMNGEPFEDRMALPTGTPCRFQIRVSGDAVVYGARFTGGSNRQALMELSREANGDYQLFAPEPCYAVLRVHTEHFHKDYEIEFLPSGQLDAVPELSEPLAALLDSSDRWDQQLFDTFREHLEQAAVAAHVPIEFCRGLQEYHLGLFHQHQANPRFGKRLETAFTRLRTFRPFSPVADFICDYILYRLNHFELVSHLNTSARLHGASAYFRRPYARATKATADGARTHKLSVVVAAFDASMFIATERLRAGDHKLALEYLTEAEDDLQSAAPDPQAAARLSFLYARAYRAAEKRARAKEHYSALVNSPTAVFAAEAESYLEES